MIASLFLLIASIVLSLISALGSAITFVLPVEFINSIEFVLGYVHIFDGIFPVQTLLQVMFLILSAWLLIQAVKIGLWALRFIPTINHHEFPSFQNEKNLVDLRPKYSGRNIVDLRKRFRTKGRLGMKDIR